MFRLFTIFLLLLVSIVTLILVYKYDGVILIDWLDYNLEISLTFALLILSFCFLVISILSSILTNIKNLVVNFRKSFYKYQKKRAYHNILSCYNAIYHNDKKKILQYKKKLYDFSQKHQSDELYEMAIICYAQASNIIIDSEKERNFFITLLNDIRFEKIALKYIIEKNIAEKKYNEALIYIEQFTYFYSGEGWFNDARCTVFIELSMFVEAKQILKLIKSDETVDSNYIRDLYQKLYLQYTNELFLKGEFKQITKELEILQKYDYLNFENVKMFVKAYLLLNQYNKALGVLNQFSAKNSIMQLEELYLEIIRKYPRERRYTKFLKNCISDSNKSYITYYIYAKHLISLENYEDALKNTRRVF